MSFKSVSRGGRIYYVPAALSVPPEQGSDARSALVVGDGSQIVFARTWAEVPLPEPEPAPVPPSDPVVEAPSEAPASPVEEVRSERRKAR